MKTRTLLTAALLPLILGTACASRMAVVSNAKTAYAVRAGLMGSDMYHCDATGSKPVCKKVEEVD